MFALFGTAVAAVSVSVAYAAVVAKIASHDEKS
jgi:hypothetical protein